MSALQGAVLRTGGVIPEEHGRPDGGRGAQISRALDLSHVPLFAILRFVLAALNAGSNRDNLLPPPRSPGIFSAMAFPGPHR